jgi:hypothetical protein
VAAFIYKAFTRKCLQRPKGAVKAWGEWEMKVGRWARDVRASALFVRIAGHLLDELDDLAAQL